MKPVLLIFLTLPFLFVQQAQRGSSPPKSNKTIDWYTMDEAQKLAKDHNKKVLVYSMATWCSYCKKMEKNVYTDPSVREVLNTYFYPVKVNIESDDNLLFNDQTMTGREFAGNFGVRGTPTFFFIDKKGEIVGMQPGYMPAKVFKKLLAYVGSDSYQDTDFDTFQDQQQGP